MGNRRRSLHNGSALAATVDPEGLIQRRLSSLLTNDENILTITLTDWMSSCGIDFFGCDEHCTAGRHAIGSALRLKPIADVAPPPRTDYAAMHDEFLESLLYEQTTRDSGDEESLDTTIAGSEAPDNERDENTLESTRKRRRPVRLRRRTSPPRRRSSCAPLSDSSNTFVVSLGNLSKSSFPDPTTYLDVQCRLQKDKGKGKPIGSEICAEGRVACLEKLRAKMRILTDNVLDKDKGPATMKRRKARISDETEEYIETRSLIELRMGFLSMTYGVLLRWDKSKDAMINLVVLRKMCNETFYPARSREPDEPQYVAALPQKTLSHVHDVIDDKHAIFQREEGTEITLLEPPYRVQRPSDFEPAMLKVSVHFATGLSRDSNWTVKITYEGDSTSVLLSYDQEQRCFIPKLGEPLKHPISNLDLSALDLKLYEHRIKKRGNRRLVETIGIPLHNLEPQTSDSAKSIRLMIPCKHDGNACVVLGLVLCSDYAHWLNKEMEARRREEVTGFVWNRTFRRMSKVEKKYKPAERDEFKLDPWDWICNVC